MVIAYPVMLMVSMSLLKNCNDNVPYGVRLQLCTFFFNFFFFKFCLRKTEFFKDPIRSVLMTPANRINPEVRTLSKLQKGLEKSGGI